MKSVTAREANQAFSRYLAEAEAGEEIVITRRGKPVARLVPDKPEITPEKRQAIERALELLRHPLHRPVGRFTRDEAHER